MAGAGAFFVGANLTRYAFGAPATQVASPYGALGAFDARGIALPPGFTSREIARADQVVAGSGGYVWPRTSDGGGTFPSLTAPGGAPDGGWYFVSNSELDGGAGGVSSVRFDSSGAVIGAQRVCSGTSRNCSGGETPWGTWLTCEEVAAGIVYEVDPTGAAAQIPLPSLGTFNHEAACVDPVRKRVYLTEDRSDGCLYRFTPTAYPDLSVGKLEVAFVSGSNVTWQEIPDPDGSPVETRHQLPAAARFNGGEGMSYDDGKVYFTTKGDRKVWILDAATNTIELLYDLALADAATPMREVDNTVVSKSGDLFICEDGDNFEICLITPDRYVSPFLRLSSSIHGSPGSNETAGVCFDPSGKRMYFSAQRTFNGTIYEISGPFRTQRPAPGVGPKTTTTTTTTTTPAPPAPAPAPVPAAPARPRDFTAPRARITSLGRQLSMGRFLQRGLSVELNIDEPAGVELTLRAPGYGVLARHRAAVGLRGLVKLRLRVTKSTFRRRLRRRRVRTLRAELTIRLRDASGNTSTARRTVKIIPPH